MAMAMMVIPNVKTVVTAQVSCINVVTFPVILVHKQRLQVHAKMALASKKPLQQRVPVQRV
jgi:hypothetical protein